MLTDIAVVIGFIIFINRLETMQEEYAEKFNDETIEMTDFCFQFENLPPNEYFEGNEAIMRYKLWNHLNNVIID